MSQADRACTTRRGLFGGLAVIAAAAAIPTTPAAAAPAEAVDHSHLLAWAKDAGDEAVLVAKHVIAAGYSAKDVGSMLVMGLRPGETQRVTIYVTDGDQCLVFDKHGLDRDR